MTTSRHQPTLIIPAAQFGIAEVVRSSDKHPLRVANANNVKIGERNWQEVYFGIADLSDWRIGSLVSDVQGMLGSELLMGYGALIDFGTAKLWLRPEKSSKR